ncbi:MAG: hypothetical protein KAJ19_28215 [Gammaproteobacteria bacterium]|nr:hypothetical protein [Gammaproteobacteria bacterium]
MPQQQILDMLWESKDSEVLSIPKFGYKAVLLNREFVLLHATPAPPDLNVRYVGHYTSATDYITAMLEDAETHKN